MSTLAKIQAESLSYDVKREVISQWFADSWLLVAENDRDSYDAMTETAKGATLVEFSDAMRESWENLAEDTTELVAEHLSPSASLFISQILQGWGSYAFDLIAKQVLDNQ